MNKPLGLRKAAIAFSDVDVLAQHVDGFEAGRYFDQQGEVETVAAARRWPLLATVMGYATPIPAPPSPAYGSGPQAGDA